MGGTKYIVTARDVEVRQIGPTQISRRPPRERSIQATRGDREAAQDAAAIGSTRGALARQTDGVASNQMSVKHAGIWRAGAPDARVVVEIHEASNKRVERTGGDARRPWQDVGAAGRSPAR